MDTALHWYQVGHETGLKEPNIKPARVDLWNFRWEHAQARIAARRGNLAEAQDHVTAAKAILDKGTNPEQAPFFPYLTGYVAFYAQDYKTAAEDLSKANQNDPFIQCLLGQTYEKFSQKAKAIEAYRKAAAALAHNPPAAYAVPFAKKRLASASTIGRERVPLTGQVLARVEPLTGYAKNLLGGQLYDVFVFGVDNGEGQDPLVPVKIVYEFYPNDPGLLAKFFDYSRSYELSVRRDARCDQNVKNLSYETDVEPGKPPHPRNILNVLNGAPPEVLKPDLILPCFFLWPGQYKTLNDRKSPD